MTARVLFHEAAIAPAAMEEAVLRGASGLERLGVRQGDVVCILLHNSPAFLEVKLAARLLGAYWCPINWHYKAEEAGWILRDSGATVLVTDPALRSQAAAGIPPELPVVADWSGFVEREAAWRGEARAPGALMPYTSATTGRAKGVRRFPQTPEQIARLQQGFAQVLGIQAGMRALHPAPLYHRAPSGYAVQAALHGELLVLEERFDAERALALIERHRLTHAYLVPTMYVRLLRLPESARKKYDLSSIRFVASTGSPLPAQGTPALISWGGAAAPPRPNAPPARRGSPSATRAAASFPAARWASSTRVSRRFRTSPTTTIRKHAERSRATASSRSATRASSARRAISMSATAPRTW